MCSIFYVLSHFILFCCKISLLCDLRCFVAKSVLSRFTRFGVEKNWAKKFYLWRKKDKYEVCICKTVYELNHLKIHKMSDVNKRHRKKLFRELQQLWLQVHDLVHKIKGKNWITRFQDYFMVTFICKTDWLAKWISSSLICCIECEIILIVNNCTGRCPIIPREVELDIWKSKMGGKDCTANNLICIPTSQPPLQETKPLLLKTWKLNEDKLPQNCLL